MQLLCTSVTNDRTVGCVSFVAFSNTERVRKRISNGQDLSFHRSRDDVTCLKPKERKRKRERENCRPLVDSNGLFWKEWFASFPWVRDRWQFETKPTSTCKIISSQLLSFSVKMTIYFVLASIHWHWSCRYYRHIEISLYFRWKSKIDTRTSPNH